MGSKHVSSEHMDIGVLGSDVDEKCHSSSGNSISKGNTVEGKLELDSRLVLGDAQNCQTMDSCHNELCSGHVQGEPMKPMESDAETLIIGPVAQNCQTTGSSIQEQNTSDENHETGSDNVSSEPMYIRTVGSDAEEKCHLTRKSILEAEENTLEGKSELDSTPVLGEPMETRTGSNAQNFQTIDSCHNERCSEHVQGEPMETRIVGSDSVDAGLLGMETMTTVTVTDNCPNTSDEKHEIDSQHLLSEPMDTEIVGSDAEDKYHIGNLISKENTAGGKPVFESNLVLGEPIETRTAGSNAENLQTMELCSEHVKREALETRIVGSDSVDVGLSSSPPRCATENVNGPSLKESTVSSGSKKRKLVPRSSGEIARVLRPRLNGLCKAPVPSGSSANVSAEGEKKRKKMKRTRKALDNEFSRTRKRVRYLLTRMGYEQNFIDAYSGEGWKGQSAEKIKPEKELQRASSEILRCKRRIRELFQHLDSSCAEGRFQESVFDSEGQISSEDIFCAKCSSTDLSADNDIILCDGICDRGFHQMCLEPPLLKEEIPPGDEGWLCPGCDCKVDCFDLLNDSQGTSLSIEDAWEKIFPEAATTAADITDGIAGLPSDDSEDYEYNPDASDVEEGVQTEGSSSENSSSEDSDFTSASDDLAVRPVDDQYLGLPSDDSDDDDPVDDQYLGLPSDDSEDDDYDPNAPVLEQTKDESSSSDFTSASDYFSAPSDANGSADSEDGQIPSSIDGSKVPGSSNRRSKTGRNKKQLINSELLSILEPDSLGDLSSVSGKRQRERLDYKKLHDEAYGNVPSDSSDDEEWTEADGPSEKKDDGVGGESSLCPKSNSQTIMGRRNTKGSQKRNSEETGDTSERRTRRKKDYEGANNLAADTHIDSPEPDLVDKKATPSAYNKTLKEAVTQRLYETFTGNNYPSRDTKEKLAKELGMTFQQVTKWFGNARWSLRHSPNSAINRAKEVSPSKEQALGKLVEPETKILSNDVDSNEVGNLELTEAGTPKTLRNGRNLNVDLDHETLEEDSNKGKVQDGELTEAGTPQTLRNGDVHVDLDHQTFIEESSSNRTLVISIPANSPEPKQVRRSGRNMNRVASQSQIQTRSRKAATPINK